MDVDILSAELFEEDERMQIFRKLIVFYRVVYIVFFIQTQYISHQKCQNFP